MLPWDLEDWLTDEGDRIVRKLAAGDVLSPNEQLIYEVWLFDTEQRNGGVSQYFCNRGLEQWELLCRLAKPVVPTISAFSDAVDAVVAGSADPYEAVVDSKVNLDEVYYANVEKIVRALRDNVATSSLKASRPKRGETAPCPKCGKPLRTAKAQQCFSCGAKWHGQS